MAQQPNFLFLFSDQHRGDWMPYDDDVRASLGVSDLTLKMPNIRGLMDRGVSFTRAVSPAPVCAPARACLAAGKRYRNCRVYLNKVNYDTNLTSFYTRLSEAGYYVCGAGKFDLGKANLNWGKVNKDLFARLGFAQSLDSEGKMDAVWAKMLGESGPYGKTLEDAGWLDYYADNMRTRGASTDPVDIPDELYADNWIGARSCDMLAAIPHDRPWFMQVNFSGPHDPWDITKRMKDAMEGRTFPEAADCTLGEQNQEVRKNYAAMIENIDRLIGELLHTLEARGDLENTIIVYGSDHGEMMGDHNLYGKSKPGEGSVHIPLVIDASHAGGLTGATNGSPIELQDLAATFCDYAGVDMPKSIESISLRPLVEGTEERVRDYAVSELISAGPEVIGSFGAVTDGRYKLILQTDAPAHLYDLEEDPFECRDLIGELPEVAERLREDFRSVHKRSAVAASYAKAFNLA